MTLQTEVMTQDLTARLMPMDAANLTGPWARLADTDPQATVVSTPEYQRALFATFGADDPQVMVIERGDQIVGVMPLAALTLRRGPATLREVGFFRGAHVLRNTLLVPPEGAAVQALLDGLLRDMPGDSLLFQNIPMVGGAIERLLQAAPKAGLHADPVQPGRVLMYAEIGNDYDDWLKSRSGHHRRQLRKRLGELEAMGRLEFDRVTGTDIIAAIPDWQAVVDASWQGQAAEAVGNTPQDWNFHRALAGNGALYLMRINGRPVACKRVLMHRNIGYLHTTNFDLGLRDTAPGLVIFNHAMRDCSERGMTRLDFNGQSEFYSRWSTGETVHQSLRLYRSTLRGKAAKVMRRLTANKG